MKKFEFAKIVSISAEVAEYDVLVFIESEDGSFNVNLFTWIGAEDFKAVNEYETIEDAIKVYSSIGVSESSLFIQQCLCKLKENELWDKLTVLLSDSLDSNDSVEQSELLPEQPKVKVVSMKPVSSSNILSVGFKESDNSMFVKFAGGGLYKYSNVPKSVFDKVFNVVSVGSYIASEVKGVYSGAKVEESELNG